MTTPALNGLEEESRSRWWQWSANAGEQINKRPQKPASLGCSRLRGPSVILVSRSQRHPRVGPEFGASVA
jgi:hypothetical protein